MPERYLPISEAAKRLGVHHTTLRKWANSGKISCTRTVGGRRRFPESEINRLFKQHSFCVIPSLWENSPYSFFEAFAAGIYCIGADTGEMGLVLNQIKGSVFTPGNEQSLLKEMLNIYYDPMRYWQVLKRQKEFISQNLNQHSNKLLDYYYSIISNRT